MGKRTSSAGISIGMGLGAFLLQGCLRIGDDAGKRGVQVKPELVRAEAKASAKAASTEALPAAPKKSSAPAATSDPDLHWSSAVAITSLKVPIKTRTLGLLLGKGCSTRSNLVMK